MARRGRKLIIALSVALVLLAALVAFAPAILSMGPARGIVASAVAPHVRGTVAVGGVDLSWSGPQRVSGLRITDSDGREATNLDVSVDGGLVGLVLGGSGPLRLAIAGALHGTLEENGSSSLVSLLNVEDASAAGGGEAPGGGSGESAGLPAIEVDVTDLAVTLDLREAGASRSIVLDALTGSARLRPGGTSEVELQSPTTSGDLAGSIDIRLAVERLIDAGGALTMRGAGVDAAVSVKSVSVPFAPQVEELTTLDLTAKTSDLAERIDFTIRMNAVLSAAESSTLAGTVTLRKPVGDDDRVRVALETTEADLTGKRVPSALFQTLFADTVVRLARDLGPSFDITARFGAPASDAVATNADGGKSVTPIELSLEAENATVSVAGDLHATGAIDGRKSRVTASLHPDLVAALGGATAEARTALEIDVASFSVPARREDGALPLADLAFEGSVRLPTSVALDLGGPLTIADVRMAVTSAGLGGAVAVKGTAVVDGGALDVDEVVTGLLDAEGAFAVDRIAAVGRLRVQWPDGSRLASRLERFDAGGAIPTLVTGPVVAIVDSAIDADGLRADVALQTDRLQVESRLVRRPEDLHLASFTASVTATPDLVAALQRGKETPVELVASAPVTMSLEPVDVPGRTPSQWSLPTDPIRGRITASSLMVKHADLAEAVRIEAIDVAVAANADGGAPLTAMGGATLRRLVDGERIADLRLDLLFDRDARLPRGTVTVENAAVDELEAVLGYAPQKLAGWTGTPGRIAIELTGDDGRDRVVVRSEMPRLKGELDAALEAEAVTLTSTDLSVTLAARLVQDLLNGRERAANTPVITVGRDLPLMVALSPVGLPFGLFRDEPIDPRAVNVDMSLRGGPLALSGGVETTFSDLVVNVSSDDLAAGVKLDVDGATAGRAGETPGIISIRGTITDLLSAESRLSADAAKITMQATGDRIPTSIVDRWLHMNGLLTAAAGPRMKTTITTDRFSLSSGSFDGRVETATGFLAMRVLGSDGALVVDAAKPMEGELALTVPFRQRILAPLHPVLADLRSTEQPLRLTIPMASVPTDGDMARLSADVRLTIGKVEFEGSSAVLGLLKLFDVKRTGPIPGSIEPIVAKIRGGVVTYDRFAVNIDKYKLVYQGSINLNTKTIDLRTEIPLETLAMSVKELQGYADKITVPLVTRGTFDKNKTEIDPKFDLAGAAVDAGFKGALNDLLKDQGVPLGDLLGDIFGGGKKKKKDGGK